MGKSTYAAATRPLRRKAPAVGVLAATLLAACTPELALEPQAPAGTLFVEGYVDDARGPAITVGATVGAGEYVVDESGRLDLSEVDVRLCWDGGEGSCLTLVPDERRRFVTGALPDSLRTQTLTLLVAYAGDTARTELPPLPMPPAVTLETPTYLIRDQDFGVAEDPFWRFPIRVGAYEGHDLLLESFDDERDATSYRNRVPDVLPPACYSGYSWPTTADAFSDACGGDGLTGVSVDLDADAPPDSLPYGSATSGLARYLYAVEGFDSEGWFSTVFEPSLAGGNVEGGVGFVTRLRTRAVALEVP